MLGSFLAFLLAAAPTAGTSPASAPTTPAAKHLAIVGGADDQAAGAELLRAAQGSKTGDLFNRLELKLLRSDDVGGLKPGFFVVAALACSAKADAERFLEILRTDHREAYLREVEDSPLLPGCPSLIDRDESYRGYRAEGTGPVVPKAKTLRWKALTKSKPSPVFRGMQLQGVVLKVVSGDTTLASLAFEPEARRDSDQRSFELHGMLKGLGRQFPVVVEKTSWQGGDMCTINLYAFRGGEIQAIVSQDNANCPKDELPWKVTGSPDDVQIIVDWDQADLEQRRLYRDLCEGRDPCVMGQKRWSPSRAAYE